MRLGRALGPSWMWFVGKAARVIRNFAMGNLALKAARYVKCYGELALGAVPDTPSGIVDYCVNRPILMAQVRSEIIELARILQEAAPSYSLEIGTNYGGTLLLLCRISHPGATIISVDLPGGRFGGGYPRRKMPLFRRFPRLGQRLHLIRGDSHSPATRVRVSNLLKGVALDYLFLDGDHSYEGVKRDFEMYSGLVRSGGVIALHDIAPHRARADCEVHQFWNEIKNRYRYREIIDNPLQGWAGIGVLWV